MNSSTARITFVSFLLAASLSISNACNGQAKYKADATPLIYSMVFPVNSADYPVIKSLNRWSLSNVRTYSASIDSEDASSILVTMVANVFMKYDGSHKVLVEQDQYKYQLIANLVNDTLQVVLRNYISTRPNSALLTTKASRMSYIEHLDIPKKRKTILKAFADQEYQQLDEQSGILFRSIYNAVTRASGKQ